MTSFKFLSKKIRIPWAIALLLSAAAFGISLRLFYVWQIGLHPVLNLSLPDTDPFMFDLMAKNINSSEPLAIQSPINPITVYFIGLVYRLFGTSPLSLYLTFFILSMISTAFLMLAGRALFGWRAGLLAGTFFVYYRMNFFYDALLDGTALSQFLLIMTLSLGILYVKKHNAFLYTGFLGFALLLCLSRVFYWFLIIPLILLCAVRFQQYKKPSLLLFNALFAVLAAISFFQFHSADRYSHKFGVHFYIGNHAGASGLMESIPGIPSTSEGFAKDTILAACAETGRRDHLNWYWIKKTIGSYRQTSASWPGLLLKKLSYLTNAYEPHNISSVYFYEKYSRLKYFPRLNFGALVSLAAAGVFMILLKRHRGGKLLLVPFVFLLMTTLSIFIASRYRMPLVPFLCLFAGFGLEQAAFLLRQKNYKAFSFLLVIIAAVWLWSGRPAGLFQKENDIQAWETESFKAWDYAATVKALREQFKNWNSLDSKQRLFLTAEFEKYRMTAEFDKAYTDLLPSVENDPASRGLLLALRARFEEKNFNLHEALRIWKKLESDPFWGAPAQKKIQDIEIITHVLNGKVKDH